MFANLRRHKSGKLQTATGEKLTYQSAIEMSQDEIAQAAQVENARCTEEFKKAELAADGWITEMAERIRADQADKMERKDILA